MICRICEKKLFSIYFVKKNKSAENVQIYYCKSCDAFFIDKKSANYECDDLLDYYKNRSSHIINRYNLMFSCVENIIKPSSFLDIGSGMGYSLDVAESRGWSAEGFEPNNILAKNCIERGLAVHNRYFKGEADKKFNFILVDNVLEHVADPIMFVIDTSRLLEENGLLVIAVPPVDWLRKSLCSIPLIRNKMNKPQVNIFYDVDQHISFFSRKAIRLIANQAGLSILPTRHHHSIFYNNYFSIMIGINDGVFFIRKI